jgi:hypothetical protein
MSADRSPRERAHAFLRRVPRLTLCYEFVDRWGHKDMCDDLAAEFAAAREEGRVEGMGASEEVCMADEDAYARGRRAGMEKAFAIVDGFCGDLPSEACAALARALDEEGKP